jgi:heat shock protein HslJ
MRRFVLNLSLGFVALAAPLAGQVALEDTRWRLTELTGKPAASPPGARQIYLRLAAQGKRLEAFAGCNTLGGAYSRDGESLKFNGLISTMMACVSMDIEDRFKKALDQTRTFKIDGATLSLLAEDKTVLARFETEDSWQKVIALASGTEIRVVRKNALTKPLLGTFDEATGERLVLVVKNEQIAIERDQIQQVDARPKGASRVTRTSQSTQNMPMDRPQAANPAERARPVPPNSTSSTSSGLSIGSKPAFETVYRAR